MDDDLFYFDANPFSYSILDEDFNTPNDADVVDDINRFIRNFKVPCPKSKKTKCQENLDQSVQKVKDLNQLAREGKTEANFNLNKFSLMPDEEWSRRMLG